MTPNSVIFVIARLSLNSAGISLYQELVIKESTVQMSAHCLVIDDDLDDQEIFLMCVREISKNIQCLTCNSGVDAISMFESNPDYIPEYIFIDVNMPKMNGIVCLGILKNMERLQKAEIFMYSTTSDRSSLQSSKILGAKDFIVKPVNTSELKEILCEIFLKQKPDEPK